MGGLFFCAWRESGLRRENGVSLGDEHVSAPADQDDQTGACGQGGQGAVQPGVSCLQGALVKADPLDGPAGPAAEDQGIPRLQNGAAVGDPLLAPAEEEDQQTVRERVRRACPAQG